MVFDLTAKSCFWCSSRQGQSGHKYLLGCPSKVYQDLDRVKYIPKDKVIFQQDSAPPNTSHKTQKRLEINIPDFWPKDMWSLSSPEQSPTDFSICAYVEDKACSKFHNSIEAQKVSIIRDWNKMLLEYVRFRPRIQEVIANNGSHIEKFLYNMYFESFM